MDRLLNATDDDINNASKHCKFHLMKMMHHFLSRSEWALKMFDSSTKVPTSVLLGNVYDFGNYDECISVDVQEEWGSFVGQHCIAEIPITLPVHKRQFSNTSTSSQITSWALCIPSSCSAKELEKIMGNIFSLDITVKEYMCHCRNQHSPFQIIDWIAITLLVILVLLCIVGTAFSICVKNPEKRHQWLLAFSWYKNGKHLFSLKSQTDSIPVLNGIRFFSIAWVVLGHSCVLRGFFPQKNSLMVTSWGFLFITNSVFAVDTFFLLSGILLCYIFMKTMANGHSFNICHFYLHRLIRILPVLGLMVLFQASILAKIGSGPLWDYAVVNSQLKDCKAYWWSTILFVQNYINIKQMCIPVSWFLAVDMQLYLLSPVFLLALLRKPKLGIGLLVGASLLGILVSFQQTYIFHDYASNIPTKGQSNDRYYQTHTRYVPWIIGLGCGYLLYRTTEWRNRVAMGAEQISKKIVIFGWISSIITIIAVFHWVYPFEQENHIYSAAKESLYLALSRPLWVLGISWIIFACDCGYGGFINTILAWKALLPLSRLTFCMYLVHFDIIVKTMAMAKLPAYTSEQDLILSFFGFLVWTVILSIIMSLTVEMPVIGLEKTFFKQGHKTSKYRRFTDEEDKVNKKCTFLSTKVH